MALSIFAHPDIHALVYSAASLSSLQALHQSCGTVRNSVKKFFIDEFAEFLLGGQICEKAKNKALRSYKVCYSEGWHSDIDFIDKVSPVMLACSLGKRVAAEAYCRLSFTLKSLDIKCIGGWMINSQREPEVLTLLQCIEIAAGIDPECPLVYDRFAGTLAFGDTGTINGHTFDTTSATVKAIELCDDVRTLQQCHYWYNLGCGMSVGHYNPERTVTVKGRTYTEAECYVRSLEMDMNGVGIVWHNLVWCDVEFDLNGKHWTRLDAVAELIRRSAIGESLGRYWLKLAKLLSRKLLDDGASQESVGDSYTPTVTLFGEQITPTKAAIRAWELSLKSNDTSVVKSAKDMLALFFCADGEKIDVVYPREAYLSEFPDVAAPEEVVEIAVKYTVMRNSLVPVPH